MKLPKDQSRFSFGATSSTVTSLGIITGLLQASNPKSIIIGSLLVIAVADNVADSLGIHIYRESTATGQENTDIHDQQFHNQIRHNADLCFAVCFFANRIRCNILRGIRFSNTNLPKLPYWRSAQNQHTKRNYYPHRRRCPRNSHNSFSRPTNLHPVRLAVQVAHYIRFRYYYSSQTIEHVKKSWETPEENLENSKMFGLLYPKMRIPTIIR